eukprot:6524146-Pyramimonas_sp.AAC.1
MVLNVVQLTNTFDSIRIPRAYPVDSVIKVSAEESDALGRQCIEVHYESFEQALVDERAADAWALVGKIGELYLEKRLDHTGITFGAAYHGRSQEPELTTWESTAPPAGRDKLKEGPTATILRRLENLISRLAELALQLHRGATHPSFQ